MEYTQLSLAEGWSIQGSRDRICKLLRSPVYIDLLESIESIPGLLKRLQIRAQVLMYPIIARRGEAWGFHLNMKSMKNRTVHCFGHHVSSYTYSYVSPVVGDSWGGGGGWSGGGMVVITTLNLQGLHLSCPTNAGALRQNDTVMPGVRVLAVERHISTELYYLSVPDNTIRSPSRAGVGGGVVLHLKDSPTN
jgi:hypothetical protein